MNFITAVAYHFYLNLPAAFTKPNRSVIVPWCPVLRQFNIFRSSSNISHRRATCTCRPSRRRPRPSPSASTAVSTSSRRRTTATPTSSWTRATSAARAERASPSRGCRCWWAGGSRRATSKTSVISVRYLNVFYIQLWMNGQRNFNVIHSEWTIHFQKKIVR